MTYFRTIIKDDNVYQRSPKVINESSPYPHLKLKPWSPNQSQCPLFNIHHIESSNYKIWMTFINYPSVYLTLPGEYQVLDS